jgi:hypothetical protein
MRAPVTRRTFVLSLAGSALAGAAARATPGPLHLGLLAVGGGRLAAEAALGADFGAAEAALTARVLGRELLLARSTAADHAPAAVQAAELADSGAVALVTSTCGEALLQVERAVSIPVLTTLPLDLAPSSGRFEVAARLAARGDALERLRRPVPDLRPLAEAPDGEPVADGVAWVAEWHASLARFGAEQLNERFARLHGRGMTGPAWCGWMAVKAAAEAALRARDGGIAAALSLLRFDGHKGSPLAFREGALRPSLHLVGRRPGSGAGPAELLVEAGAEQEPASSAPDRASP